MTARLAISISLIILSLWGSYTAARAGLAGTIARYAPETEFLQTAVRLAPNDPKLHYLLGQAYLYDPDNINHPEAIRELNRAIELSPNDYLLWLARAKALERSGDLAGAEASIGRSVSLAPHYFEPRWQLANLLLRVGKLDQALPELRQALSANQEQTAYALELVWQISGGDERLTDSILPSGVAARFEYSQFLISKGRYHEGVAQWRTLPAEERAVYGERARQLIEQLFAVAEYDLAWEIWRDLPENSRQKVVKGQFYNGNFEQPIEKQLAGFEWQFEPNQPEAKLSIDPSAPHSGSRSLRIDYAAEGSPSFDHIRQIILVEPGHEYRLRYFARSEELATGSPPVVEIADAAEHSTLLVRSEPSLLGSVDWKPFEVTFKVGADTRALLVAIRRYARCQVDGPCPIFGRVWFTGFVLEAIK